MEREKAGCGKSACPVCRAATGNGAMERTATPARAKAVGNSQASPPTATAPVVDSTELDAAVFEEAGEPVTMVQAVADGFGDDGLRRDARELLFEPDFESQHERLALFLAHGTALVGRSAADRLLNRVEKSDAIEGFARDGCGAALGDFEELSSQMCPAEGDGIQSPSHRGRQAGLQRLLASRDVGERRPRSAVGQPRAGWRRQRR